MWGGEVPTGVLHISIFVMEMLSSPPPPRTGNPLVLCSPATGGFALWMGNGHSTSGSTDTSGTNREGWSIMSKYRSREAGAG